MKRWIICLAAALAALTVFSRAVELPQELTDALPEGTEGLIQETDLTASGGLAQGVGNILEELGQQVGDVVRDRVRGAAAVMLAVVLCGAVEGVFPGAGSGKLNLTAMAGAVSITLLTAGSLNSLMGLGTETINSLADFSHVLMPVLAAATAAAGALTTATAQQVGAVVLVDALLRLIQELLLPLTYLYVGVLTASAMLPQGGLAPLADGIKKVVTWILTTSLVTFTLYLSVAKVISGAADAVSVKLTKAAISGVVPVVGGIISEAAETVLAGAGLLKNTIGLAGTLVILAACAYPFLQLGVQYLLYKLTAFFACTIGPPELCRLISGLGGAFGLVLGMTGACALLLLVAVLSSVGAVVS